MPESRLLNYDETELFGNIKLEEKLEELGVLAGTFAFQERTVVTELVRVIVDDDWDDWEANQVELAIEVEHAISLTSPGSRAEALRSHPRPVLIDRKYDYEVVYGLDWIAAIQRAGRQTLDALILVSDKLLTDDPEDDTERDYEEPSGDGE